MARKVIIVAPKAISDFISEQYGDWDTQISCESIGDMWQGLATEELSQESDIILIVDALFNETPEEFIETVAMLAPEALVMIVSYNSKDAIINGLVKKFAQNNQISEAPFYFLRPEIALIEMEANIHQYDHANDEPSPIFCDEDPAKSIVNADYPHKVYSARKIPVVKATWI